LIHPLVSPALPFGRACARVSRALLVTLGPAFQKIGSPN
jgi:hypothetical protein